VQKRATGVSCTPQGIMRSYDANFKVMLITTLRKPTTLSRTMQVERVALIGKVDGISYMLCINNIKLTTKYFLSTGTHLRIRAASHLGKYGMCKKVQDFITHKEN
jgi:hypothetical protein